MAGKEDWLEETHFDAVVVGTGITESVVAAALSRAGRKVLHLDSLPFYGTSTATLQLSQFKDWLGRLSFDDPAQKDDESPSKRSPWDATEAEVDEETVATSKRIAEGLEIERDAMNRPILEDGLAREQFRPAVAIKAEIVPRMFSDISFEERMEPITPREKKSLPAESKNEGVAVDEEEVKEEGGEGGAGAGPANEAVEEEEEEVLEGWQELLLRGRDYNIDFTPKLNLSSGKLVAALLKSGVGRYLEFMPLKSTFIHAPSKGGGDGIGALQRVPMSKADIFQASSISPIEKRLLMKFLQTCLSLSGVEEAKDGGWAVQGVGGSEQEQLGFKKAVGHLGDKGKGTEELSGKTLGAFMTESKLSATIKGFVAHGIALTGEDTPAEEAVRRVQEYALSLGRYSASAFLACYYGVAEVPQAFCRMGAVYGGIYVLRRTAGHFLVDKETGNARGVICSNGQRIRAPIVIASAAYMPREMLCGAVEGEDNGIRRCVCVCSGPVVDEQGVCLAMLPPGACGNKVCIRILQLDVTAQACPRGKYVWHLWGAEAGPCDLKAAVELLRRLAPTVAVHWSAFYTQRCPEGVAANRLAQAQQLKPGLWMVPSPSAEVDSGDAIAAAERLFAAVAQHGEEYLEAMPEPELVEDEPELGPGVDLFQPQPATAPDQWTADGEQAQDLPPTAAAQSEDAADKSEEKGGDSEPASEETLTSRE